MLAGFIILQVKIQYLRGSSGLGQPNLLHFWDFWLKIVKARRRVYDEREHILQFSSDSASKMSGTVPMLPSQLCVQ